MKILTCTDKEFSELENAEEYDYIILVGSYYAPVGHKCTKPTSIYSMSPNFRHFRWHSTKHCKICHKTWPKEVQVTANMV
jgi:hypothetical protein